MHTSKTDRYQKLLQELKELRSQHKENPERESTVLEIMEVLWIAMEMDEREYFGETNHLSWPPPRDNGDTE